MKNNPKVSVIIPAYNAERFIEACLKSLQNQTYKNIEIIVVDDGSKDNTAKIAEKYAKVVSNDTNLGEGASRNNGAKASSGEILVFTDADVVVKPDWIESLLHIMNTKSVYVVAGGYCGSVGDSFIERFAFLELQIRRQGLGENVYTAVTNNFACYRDVFFKCGGFPEKYNTCEDLAFSFILSQQTPIYWNKENGVLHNFRKTLWGYLKQQYHFAKDSVIVYYELPVMLLRKTHQGRSLYVELLVTLFALPLAFFISPAFLLIFLIIIVAINLPLLKLIRENKMSVIKAVFVIILRNLSAIAGFIVGVLKCLLDLLKLKKLR